MAEPVTNERIYELLTSIQDGLTRLERGLHDIGAELRGQNHHLAALSTGYAALVGDDIRHRDQLDDLRRRIERLEHHLDPTT